MGTCIGLERLISTDQRRLRGRRFGLLCHPASVSQKLHHAADLLAGCGGTLVRLFGPEHGIRGDAQDMVGVEEAIDPRLGVPVVSLYGQRAESLRPDRAYLADLDLLVIDLQDVGSRYYTYIWTMVMCLEVCAETGTEVLVLDRPNPLGGLAVEGPGIEDGYRSFVGYHDVPTRHGLTIGEVARLTRTERKIDVELTVIPMEGWRRDLYFDGTGLPWVLPSPNMPTLDTAIVYPGGCLLEGTNISEGRGTTRPFEITGAAYLDGNELAQALSSEGMSGVAFRPLSFRPTFHKFKGQVCGGIQVHVLDRAAFRSVRAGVALLLHARRLRPQFFSWRTDAYEFVAEVPAIDLLAGGSWLREGVEAGQPLAEMAQTWTGPEAEFRERRKPYLLY